MSTVLDAELAQEFPASGGRSTVEVEISSVDKTRETTRQVVLVVDASSSMGPDLAHSDRSRTKIQWAREGVLKVLEELEPDDHVSLLSFNRTPDVHVPMGEWGEQNQSEVREMVTGTESDEYDGELSASGGTDIHEAIEEAWGQFSDVDTAGTVSRDIVLLSDGKDSRDLSDFEQLASDTNDDGITISAGGIGDDYKEEVLLALADGSGGKAHHLQGDADIESFLRDRVREAGDTVASNPKLRIDLSDSFIIDEDEEVFYTQPTRNAKHVQFDDEGAFVGLQRLVVGEDHRFTFRILGMPQQTGLAYDVGDLTLLHDDGDRLATTSLEADYRDDPSEKTRIEKDRESAEIIVEMKEEDADKDRIEERIEDLENERGWTKTAADLRDDLERTEEPGGKVRVSNPGDEDQESEDEDRE